MLTNVAVALLDEIAPFEFGIFCEVFGIDRSDHGLPVYDFAVCAAQEGPLAMSGTGFTVSPNTGWSGWRAPT